MTPEDLIRAAAAHHDDPHGELAASALAALARRVAGAGQDCSRCLERLPLSAFGVDASREGGIAYMCRRCRARKGPVRR